MQLVILTDHYSPFYLVKIIRLIIIVLYPYFLTGHEAAVMTVATIAKLCIAMSFASAYVYSSEVYPTSIINAAVGFCVTAGRLGGTVAPAFLALVGPFAISAMNALLNLCQDV